MAKTRHNRKTVVCCQNQRQISHPNHIQDRLIRRSTKNQRSRWTYRILLPRPGFEMLCLFISQSPLQSNFTLTLRLNPFDFIVPYFLVHLPTCKLRINGSFSRISKNDRKEALCFTHFHISGL